MREDYDQRQEEYHVLIEPLWNWNNGRAIEHKRATGLNRTFMELKYKDEPEAQPAKAS